MSMPIKLSLTFYSLLIAIAGCSRTPASAVDSRNISASESNKATDSGTLGTSKAGKLSRDKPSKEGLQLPQQTASRIDENGPKPMYGPIESSLLREGAIDAASQKQLEAENFDGFMTAFEKENANNVGAQKLTKDYLSEINRTMAAIPQSAAFTRFSCGENVCMGYTRSAADSNWFQAWYNSFISESQAPVKAMNYGNLVLPGGGTEHRILFTTQGEAAFYSRTSPPKKGS